MKEAFEKILERLDAKKQYFQKFYEADGKTEEDEYINKATQLAFDDAKNIVQEVAEEYKGDMKHNLAEMYAKNMVDYGVDVTKAWQTAMQQSCALEKAYIRGRQYEVDRFYELRKKYKGGWIPCSERLPEEHDSIFAKLKGTDKWYDAMFEKISDDVNVTVEFEDGTRKTMTLHTNDGKWNTGNRIAKFNVIAWQPLPEPYQPKGE